MEFTNLLFDNASSTNESLKDTLAELKSFTSDVVDGRGAPPVMLATWGDEKFQCVLKHMKTKRIFFNRDGEPTRAQIDMTLIEHQDEPDGTGVALGT